jgi:hypothetical protein
MRRGIIVGVALLTGGCTFLDDGNTGEGPQLAEPDLEPVAPGETAGAPEPEPEPDPMAAGDAGDDGMTSGLPDDPGDLPPPGGRPADTGDESGSGTDGGEPPPQDVCPETFTDLLWAQDATIAAPMQLVPATQAEGQPVVAVSPTLEQGTVQFQLDLPCAGDYYLHGLMWDYSPGAWAVADPDSLYVSTGGPSEFVWRYGCQTGGASDALTWQSLEQLDAQPCSTTPIVLTAPSAGVYAFTLRNREAGQGGSVVAGIGAVVVTMDPALDPYDEYDPYP